jgi:4-diphosphocytidyl-2-C-methyl-D-erythritol kinase
LNQPITTWKSELKNDFEVSAFAKYPQLSEIKQKIYSEGAVYASMTGSGSTLYGIYKEKPKLTFSNYFEKIIQTSEINASQ